MDKKELMVIMAAVDGFFAGIEKNISVVEDLKKTLTGLEATKYKIDILENVLSIMRIKYGHLKNKIPLDDLAQNCFNTPPYGITYKIPKTISAVKKSISDIVLQPLLLFFLFKNHEKKLQVDELINEFALSILDDLELTDFDRTEKDKKTYIETARKAARKLMDFGLIEMSNIDPSNKKSKQTWVPTILGGAIYKILIHKNNQDLTDPMLQCMAINKGLNLDIIIAMYMLEAGNRTLREENKSLLESLLETGVPENERVMFDELIDQYLRIHSDISLTKKESKEKRLQIIRMMKKNPANRDLCKKFIAYLRNEGIKNPPRQ